MKKKRAQHKSLPFPTHELFWTDSWNQSMKIKVRGKSLRYYSSGSSFKWILPINGRSFHFEINNKHLIFWD